MPSSQPQSKHVLDLPRNRYPVKILQFGSGNFLRGFADWMIQEANRKVGFNAGVAIIQSISNSTALQEQEGVYTVILKGIRDEEYVSEYFTVDAIQRVVYPSLDYNSFLEEALNPDLQIIISNTTEAGIQFLPSDDKADVPAASFPGKLTQLLYQRFKQNLNNSLIILPTELIENNGTVLKSMVQQYAQLWALPATFNSWLTSNITFCNTLVDRIVSGFPKKPKQLVFEEIGYKDELAVEGEWFHLWVIEGPRWINEVLPFKKAGFNVIITNDLTPYRVRKVRILNGAHTSMAVIGCAGGIQNVRDALDHPHLGKFIRRLIYDDIVPHIPGDIRELEKYADDVINRFRNPAIDHKLEHIALNSFSKYKVRVLPSLIDNMERNGHVPERLSFTFAALLYYYRGHGEGKQFTLNDSPEVISLMKKAWSSAELSEAGTAFVCQQVLFDPYWGVDLKKYPQLVERICQQLYSIVSKGLMESLKNLENSNLK
jgi:tagaturonate reductase